MLKQPGTHHAGRLLRKDAAFLSLRAGRAGEIGAEVIVVRVDLRVHFVGAAARRQLI